jgi:hypothetical protein
MSIRNGAEIRTLPSLILAIHSATNKNITWRCQTGFNLIPFVQAHSLLYFFYCFLPGFKN